MVDLDATAIVTWLLGLVATQALRLPGARTDGFAAELSARAAARYAAPVSRAMSIYILLQAVVIVAATMTVLIAAGAWPTWPAGLACATVAAGAVALAGLGERRRWALPLEVGRLVATVVVAGLVLARGLVGA